MSTKIEQLPLYGGSPNPNGHLPISIEGTTYKIAPELIGSGGGNILEPLTNLKPIVFYDPNGTYFTNQETAVNFILALGLPSGLYSYFNSNSREFFVWYDKNNLEDLYIYLYEGTTPIGYDNNVQIQDESGFIYGFAGAGFQYNFKNEYSKPIIFKVCYNPDDNAFVSSSTDVIIEQCYSNGANFGSSSSGNWNIKFGAFNGANAFSGYNGANGNIVKINHLDYVGGINFFNGFGGKVVIEDINSAILSSTPTGMFATESPAILHLPFYAKGTAFANLAEANIKASVPTNQVIYDGIATAPQISDNDTGISIDYTDTANPIFNDIIRINIKDNLSVYKNHLYTNNLTTNRTSYLQDKDGIIAYLDDIPTINEHYRGTYTTLSALNTAHPTANAGDYAVVDAGVGSDAKIYIWDSSDNAWVQSSSSSASTTDALPEGSTNLYFTASRAVSALSSYLSNKVDKVTGYSLTKNDLTDALKTAYDNAVSSLTSLLATGSRLITNAEITKLSNTSGTNTGDQNLSGLVPYSGATNDVDLGAKNLKVNNIFEGFTSVVASGTLITLTVNSTPSYLITGSGGQTIKLPDATTLTNGSDFYFNNNQSSGAILVNNNSNTLVKSVPSGGYLVLTLIDNSIAAGSWDAHFQAPSNVSWSTNTFDYAGSITSATWNGVSIADNRIASAATWNAKEDSSNKSTSTSDSASSVKFPVWSAIISYFDASRIRTILGISTLSGSNTGDQDLSGLVPTTRTVNSKPLSSNITLNTGDIADTTDKRYQTDNQKNYNDATSSIQTQLDSKQADLVTTNRQTASYTLVLSDRSKLVEMNVASANNLTVPPNSSVAFAIGTKIDIAQYGAGQTTIVAGSGVTIRSANSWLKLNAQYAGATLTKIGTDEWYLFGNLNA